MELVHECTYTETIVGPWGPTTGSPFGARLCWQISSAALTGPRIRARLAMPGADWVRLASTEISPNVRSGPDASGAAVRLPPSGQPRGSLR
jgi:hypothetical protein